MKTKYLDAYINVLRKKSSKIFVQKKIKINSNDILFVIDMQNDFIPDSPDSKKEGAFSVVEGDEIIRPIAKLIKNIKCKIIASRDYHPKEHCSFKNFPPHCLWNSVGSKFAKPIERELLKKKDDVVIGFKGFHKIADSFGAITYKKKYAKERKELCYNNKYKCCQNINLTGSFILDTSSTTIAILIPITMHSPHYYLRRSILLSSRLICISLIPQWLHS